VREFLLGASFIVAMSVAGVAHAQTDATGTDPPAIGQVDTSEVSLSYVDRELPEDKKTWKHKTWNFTIAPYVIYPFMNGSLTLANQTVDVQLNTGDILKRLRWFLMLYFEAKHPKFSIATDLLYMNLGDGGQLPVTGRSADFKMQQLAAELVVFGQIVKWFELGGGGRVNFVQSALAAPPGMVLPPIDLDFRKTWFDPLIAVRFSAPFKNDHWRLGLRADFGGFTIGSTYAWQVYPYGGYNFDGLQDRRVFELAVAFRAIGMKYETGSGPRRFVYDMIIWGPQLGFLFHF
jgi:hypothetical protein